MKRNFLKIIAFVTCVTIMTSAEAQLERPIYGGAYGFQVGTVKSHSTASHEVGTEGITTNLKSGMASAIFELTGVVGSGGWVHLTTVGPWVGRKNGGNVSHWWESGGGWFLHPNRPISLGGDADLLIGLGGNIGIGEVFLINSKGKLPKYNAGKIESLLLHFDVELAASVQISDKMNIHTLFSFGYSESMTGGGNWGKHKGGRFKMETWATYKITRWFGVTLKPYYVGHSLEFKLGKNTPPPSSGVSYETSKVKFGAWGLQFGVAFGAFE